jgi:outer membrane protein
MKRSLALALILASGLTLSAVAQTPAPAPGPSKVAVIAFQAVVAQTNEFQRNYADLQKKYEPKRQEIEKLGADIDTLTKQLEAQAATLSPADQTSRAAAIDTKKKQLQRDTEDAQTDFQNDMQEVFKGVASKVYDVMSDYVQKQGYTMVLDASQEQSPVLFAVDAINITKPVLDAYNLKSGVPAPAAGAAAPKPAAAPAHPAATAPKPATTH